MLTIMLAIWFGTGILLFAFLWKHMHINWKYEQTDVKGLLIVTPLFGPIVLLVIAIIGLLSIIRGK